MKKISSYLLSIILFTCSCKAQQKITALKGTWITNVASDALLSEKNIKETVALCKQQGMNNLFVVVWNGGVTMYPSEVVESFIGIKQDTVYKGFDPIASIVKEAHEQGLLVHAWFEFGFSYAYKDSNSVWLNKYKHWIGKDVQQKPLKKNGFYWWNAIHPEVQSFMNKLVLETITKYKFDGIQGDDRLPAMPAEGGYDAYTMALYKNETGVDAPADCREPKWLQWKANQLSLFGKNLYNLVKKNRPNCIVSWSPSIYPWSKEQYLQDWPTWMKEGYADYIIPQCYRYDLKGYEKVLNELKSQLTPEQMKRVFPGVLTSLGDGYLIKDELLQQKIQLNRKLGFNGECFFYFESFKKINQVYKN